MLFSISNIVFKMKYLIMGMTENFCFAIDHLWPLVASDFLDLLPLTCNGCIISTTRGTRVPYVLFCYFYTSSYLLVAIKTCISRPTPLQHLYVNLFSSPNTTPLKLTKSIYFLILCFNCQRIDYISACTQTNTWRPHLCCCWWLNAWRLF